MFIKAKSYNIPDITLDEPLSIGTNTIGTLDDYEHILNLIKEAKKTSKRIRFNNKNRIAYIPQMFKCFNKLFIVTVM